MDKIKFAETILNSLEAFWLLQELENDYSHVNSTRKTLDNLYSQRKASYNEIRPLLRPGTILILLAPALAFAHSLAEKGQLNGFSIRDAHRMTYSYKGTPETPGHSRILKTIRNSLSHFTEPFALSDIKDSKAADHISFPGNEAVRFNNIDGSELLFATSEGFIKFVNDLIPAIKRRLDMIIKEHLENSTINPGR